MTSPIPSWPGGCGSSRTRSRQPLSDCPPGPIRVVSFCAGQGRDLLGVLADHPRRDDVRARLVELDPVNAEFAAARAAPFPGVEVVCGDAAETDVYVGAVPAEVVLVCGVFGNIVDVDIERTIAMLPQFCTRDAVVIWTRHRREPDLTPTVRRWFADTGFDELAFVAPDDAFFAVGAHRLTAEPQALATRCSAVRVRCRRRRFDVDRYGVVAVGDVRRRDPTWRTAPQGRARPQHSRRRTAQRSNRGRAGSRR